MTAPTPHPASDPASAPRARVSVEGLAINDLLRALKIWIDARSDKQVDLFGWFAIEDALAKACVALPALKEAIAALASAQEEIAKLRAERDEAWMAGRDEARRLAIEFRDEQAELAIDTDDDEAARFHAARAVAGNTIRLRITALTAPSPDASQGSTDLARDPEKEGTTDV